jgi:hypothetical protein
MRTRRASTSAAITAHSSSEIRHLGRTSMGEFIPISSFQTPSVLVMGGNAVARCDFPGNKKAHLGSILRWWAVSN